uniref:Testis expressed 48 n=1 Tax=Ailuropoda melanoleuca TaxID=9646 RepID=A0A7N5JFB5_AILME
METVRSPMLRMTPRSPVTPESISHRPAACRRKSWPARIPKMLAKPPACLWDSL